MFKRLRKSLTDAGRGLKYTFNTEQNFRLQIALGILATIGIIFFPLRNWERILVILLIFWVLGMELLNTALERFADLLKPRLHDYVWVVKDVMAGAVLLTSLGAGIIGLIIFLPYFINFFK